MQRKTINSLLTRKFNDWIKSIKDEGLRAKIKDNVIITGGCISSLFLNEEPKDFDIYFTNKETVKSVAEYYVKQFKELHSDDDNRRIAVQGIYVEDGAKVVEEDVKGEGWRSNIYPPERIWINIPSRGVVAEDENVLEAPTSDVLSTERAISELDNIDEKYLDDTAEKEIYRPIFLSSNAITLFDKIQLVIRFYGSPEEIHKNYDFVHCTGYWTSKEKKVEISGDALECILTKTLLYQGSKYPVASIIRLRKFIKRGWHINAGQMLKIMFQISALNLMDIAILEDQLIGVDTAYFDMLINAVQERMEKDDGFKLSQEYIVSIIDKIF